SHTPYALFLPSAHAARSRVLSLFFLVLRRPPRSTLFPYTTLFRSSITSTRHSAVARLCHIGSYLYPGTTGHKKAGRARLRDCSIDRKSTRLNSSHVKISYAVFCLKKKKD